MKLEIFYPIKNPFIISQKFGENAEFYQANYGMASHNGWDIVGTTGQTIRASHDGKVVFTGEDGRGGLGVVIRTLDERDYKDGKSYFKTIYWHCLPGSFLVKPGDVIKVGTPIAKCDSTGFTGNSHLHFGLKPVLAGEDEWTWVNLEQSNGWLGAIDPAPYFNGMYAEDYRSLSDQLSIIAKKVAELFQLIFKK